MATRKTAALASFRVTEADSGAHGVNGPTRSGITGVILMRDAHMEFLEGLLPRFGRGWTAGCEAIVTDNGGSPPNINYPADTIYAYPDVVDEDSQTAMEEYLQGRVSDRVSRFTVLRYLWTAWHASVPPEGIWDAADHREEDPDEKAMRIDARKALLDFVDLLVPESITTPEQALWGFKQAFILYRWERLKRLGHQYAKLAKLTSDDLNLLLARALWLPNSRYWAELVLALASGHPTGDLSWEALIDGDQLEISNATSLPPEPHEAGISRELVLEVIAYLRNIRQETMGAHWGILADCEAMTNALDQCAAIWENHGAEILRPVADAVGRAAPDILSMPEYQFEIANLWQQAGHTDKEIEVLEFLRGRFPRLQGVNRRLGDCYALTGDLDAAALRYQDEAYCDEAFKEDKIVRALLWKCGNREESLADRIKSGETPTLEFKSSLRWNIHKNAFDKDIENSVLKTIVAFCNTKGGELLIGVKDNGEILGLDIDNFKNADKFLLHLTNLLLDRIGPDIMHSVQSEIVPIQGEIDLPCDLQTKQARSLAETRQ